VQPERAQFRPQLDRKTVGTVDFGSERRDPVFGKIADRGPQHVDLRAEIKIERGKPRVVHSARYVIEIASLSLSSGGAPRRPVGSQ